MEREVDVKAVRVHQMCEECEDGELKATGVTYMTSPPRYEHRCNKCNHKETFRKIYPAIEYREV